MGSFRKVSIVYSLVVALCFLLQFCLAVNRMTPGQLIRTNETLISEGQNFVLGFFNTSTTQNHYLGIWYNNIRDRTVVWVANREDPLTDSSGTLQIRNDGNLVIFNGEGRSLWSTNISVAAKNPTAKLLDSGNLIIIEAQNENYLWQSFDDPTDTLLPGMKLGLDLKTGLDRFLTSWKSKEDPSRGDFSYKLDRRGSPQLFIYSNSTPKYRTGPWIGDKFSGTPELDFESFFNFSFTNTKDEIYYTFSIRRKSIISRLVMNESGILQRFNWDDQNQSWSQLWKNPRDDCDRYKECPPFASCNSNSQPLCSCLEGFDPKSVDDWYLRNFSVGCERKTKLNCRNGDGFLRMPNIKFPDTSHVQIDEGLSLVDCEAKCLNNCACTAYANANISGRGCGCLTWSGDLIDLREISNSDQQFYLRISASELNTSRENLADDNPKNRRQLIVIVTVTTISAALLISCSGYLWKRKRKPKIKVKDGKKKSQELLLLELRTAVTGGVQEIPDPNKVGDYRNKESGLWLLELDVVAAVTDDFSDANKVGEGGFGPVYKGQLPDGQEIAVKRLSKESGQGLQEFKNEVLLISKLQHKNLVRLLGCCLQEEEKILIYEYMANGSLDLFIFDKGKSSLLDWGKRMNIIVGIARGLLYLHHDSRLRVIHRDLKAGNILLDDHMNPKIADFGMARIFGGDQTQAITCKVVGTHGYMSPEYIMDGLFSEKSDVFSFGVLLLEIMSGKKNTGSHEFIHSQSLLAHAWNLWKEGRGLELIDPSMVDSYTMSEVLRSIQVGLLCVQEWAIDRPTMPSVYLMLSSETTTLPLPKEPAFYTRRLISETESSSNKHGTWSNCEITVTLEDGR